MKVFYFVKGLGLGGAERHVVDCAVASKEKGYHVKVIFILRDRNAFVPTLSTSGVEVSCVGGMLWFLYCPFLFLINVLRDRPDVVHAHLPIPAFIARVFKHLVGYKVITTEHNMYNRLRVPTRFLHRVTQKLDDATISCSSAVADSLPWHSTVIDNGISSPKPQPDDGSRLRNRLSIPKDDVIFACVANLYRKKNIPLLIRAFDAMCQSQQHTDSHLVIIGQDGTEKVSVTRLVDTLDSKQRIHFWGGDPEAASLLYECDVFCLSSDYEGLPLSLLESMFAGLPAIVTDAGGMSNVVVDGDTGFVVEVGDASSYADRMFRMYQDPAMRQRMGTEAQRKASAEFSISSMCKRLHAMYEHVTGLD